jgi:hypothetical protein
MLFSLFKLWKLKSKNIIIVYLFNFDTPFLLSMIMIFSTISTLGNASILSFGNVNIGSTNVYLFY